MKLIAVVILAFLAWRMGYEQAHREIANECRRLGGFYVGSTTYRCTAVEEVRND